MAAVAVRALLRRILPGVARLKGRLQPTSPIRIALLFGGRSLRRHMSQAVTV